MNKCFIVFTKYYDDLNSKTKLRASLDDKIVNNFNKACYFTIKDKLRDHNVYWSVNHKDRLIHPDYKNQNIIFQKGESFAEILIDSISRLNQRYDRIGILGTDCPQIDIKEISRKNDNLLFGKCSDGGFYYFEFPASMDLSVFNNVRYSSEYAFKDLAKNIDSKFELLETLFDVDRIDDLYNLKNHYLAELGEDELMKKFFKEYND